MSEFNYSTSMFIGETIHGLPSPVFYDPHTAIFNNKPPATVITGSPGSGKTFLALTLATISAILGKTTIILDPKGDFLSLQSFSDEIGDISFWNLNDHRKRGLLDPFYMAEHKGEKLDLVLTVIEMFLGGLSPEERTVLSPVIKDTIDEPTPSLMKLTEALRSSEKVVARNLATNLDLIRQLPFAELCFAPGNSSRSSININQGLTVITMVGMDALTQPPSGNNDMGSSADSRKRRLQMTIFFLVTDFIRRVMIDDASAKPKTLIIDEAWAVLSNSAGANCIKSVALLGRSKKLALILVTQNNSHLQALDIENTISTRFAFGTKPKEAKAIAKDMMLPENEGYDNILTQLSNGECLIQDFQGRYAIMKVSSYKQDWKQAFETNPLKKLRAKKKQEKLAS